MSTEKQILDLVSKVDPDDPISYVQKIVKPLAKEKLDKYILGCDDCEISCNSKKSLSKGNPNASIMIIGESVSQEQQDRDSKVVYPFDDKAGEYLKEILEYYNVNEKQLFYLNSVNCFPTRNGVRRSSTVTERNNCKVFLDYAIKTVDPLMIICLGAVAVNGINEEIGKQKISDIRGKMFSYRGIDIMPTFHPAYFIELDGKVPDELIETYHSQFVEDIGSAIEYLKSKYENIKILNK